jgi:alkyl sulfatase BDS1-like metallo-beta-lactamase superfamily hydrolase
VLGASVRGQPLRPFETGQTRPLALAPDGSRSTASAPRPRILSAVPRAVQGGWRCRALALAGVLALGAACGGESSGPSQAEAADAQGHTAPSSFTVARNAASSRELALEDPQDFEDARRGLLRSDPEVEVRGPDGARVWSTADYAFVDGAAPASVNPSLWRQARLNGLHGLFEVVEGVYQVRGYDLSNLSLIRGRTGWIVVDPLTSRETAGAALELARRHFGDVPVAAVILTHSHVDHFGGVGAVLPDPSAGIPVVAPRGFLEEATSENVLAGIAMGRRASFMYGMPLARSPRGHVDTGLGKEPARGSVGIVEPTDLVDRTPQEMEIDGVRFVFQYAPESEAPAELTFYLPEKKAFCGAEIVTHTLHNLYTLRGAKVRDALRWSGYIDEALGLFGDAEVVFASHHWPVWGNERVRGYLGRQRDLYRYLHDQTLRLANAGLTPREIAEEIELPETLRRDFAARGYYGTVRHDAKAVYQAYFGWYDGNPAHLDPLPPVEAGRRYVAAMGGAAEVLRQARLAFEQGEYRWAAMLLDHLVFAEPGNDAARELLAASYDQLGYQAESGPWRDVYLTGAFELRHGVQGSGFSPASAAGLLRHLPLDDFFEALAVQLDAGKAEGKQLSINFVFTDVGETHVLTLENAVLRSRRGEADPKAAATVRLTRDLLVRLATAQAGLRELIFSDELAVDGSRLELLSFLSLFDRPAGDFPIVTP